MWDLTAGRKTALFDLKAVVPICGAGLKLKGIRLKPNSFDGKTLIYLFTTELQQSDIYILYSLISVPPVWGFPAFSDILKIIWWINQTPD